MNCHYTKLGAYFFVAALLFFVLAHCGVKLPPKSSHSEVGPHQLLEKESSKANDVSDTNSNGNQ